MSDDPPGFRVKRQMYGMSAFLWRQEIDCRAWLLLDPASPITLDEIAFQSGIGMPGLRESLRRLALRITELPEAVGLG